MESTRVSWNAPEWLEQFRKASASADRNKLRGLRVAIYENTLAAVREEGYVCATGEEVVLPWDHALLAGSEMVRAELPAYAGAERFDTSIRVVCEDCLSVSKQLVSEGERVVVLNMANRSNPGGGVLTGAGAQEEYLFRCSNLFLSLYQYAEYAGQYGVPMSTAEQYPMDRNHGGCYSPGVTVIRGLEEEGYPLLQSPWTLDVVSVAGINRPDVVIGSDGEERIADAMVPGVMNKIRTILRHALHRGNRVIVLGALGCGAFRNPPRHTAEIFRDVMREGEFVGAFRKVVFAIKEDHNSRGKGNFQPFHDVFSE